MKSLLLKISKITFLVFGFVLISAQQSMKIPKDAIFYMQVNGKEVNKKINWEKFNPIIQELTKKESQPVVLDEDEVETPKKSEEKPSWNDYAKTGIKYDATQYHYGTFNDSVKAYTTHFTIDNKEKFKEFIRSRKKEGQEVTKKNKYEYVDLSDEMFVAWNDNHAMLSFISYEKPYNYDDLDSAATAVDSAVAVVDSIAYDEAIAVDSAYVEEPFNYKNEIENLKNNIKYLKENIKDSNAEIAQLQKDIKYLEKHKQYPPEKEEANIEDSEYGEDAATAVPYNEEEPEENDEYEIQYQKEMDSINIEKFKITRKLAEDKFNLYFNSNLEIDVPKEMLKFRDATSDVFIYTDYGRIFTEGIYRRMPIYNNFTGILSNAYNSNSSYNLFFDDDKVRLVNNFQHKDQQIQNSMADVYKGKKNKKLAALINDKSVGYYSMNINGSKYFDMIYSFIQDTKDNEYQKEMELVMETMKVILDEEAITKIAPGNGIFVLNELKTKNVEYTDFEYDEDYNETEIKKTKDIAVPNFVFAFATENEGYWNRVFNLLISNKHLAEKFSKVGQFYAFKNDDKNDYIDQMYFTVKDGIVYITTSMENINPVNQSTISKNWAKDSSKYAMSGRLDFQKLINGLEKEFKSPSEIKTLDVFRKNLGDLEFKTQVKGESIETEMNYNIKNTSENSLMYFFDLFDEILKINEQEKEKKVL